MSGYMPRAGDRVRVVLEGTVHETFNDSFAVRPTGEPGGNYIFPSAAHVMSVERLPDPEPEWRPGDVICCDARIAPSTVLRRGDRWVCDRPGCDSHNDTWVTEKFRDGLVTLLVRDGKPVTP